MNTLNKQIIFLKNDHSTVIQTHKDGESEGECTATFVASVSRFAEILPLIQYFNSLLEMHGLGLVFGKILYLLWQFLHYWVNFRCCKMDQDWKIMKPSGHTVYGGPQKL